ncbi:hypothetical protein B0H17DRAFT_1052265, partial [Mycena rosella]
TEDDPELLSSCPIADREVERGGISKLAALAVAAVIVLLVPPVLTVTWIVGIAGAPGLLLAAALRAFLRCSGRK